MREVGIAQSADGTTVTLVAYGLGPSGCPGPPSPAPGHRLLVTVWVNRNDTDDIVRVGTISAVAGDAAYEARMSEGPANIGVLRAGVEAGARWWFVLPESVTRIRLVLGSPGGARRVWDLDLSAQLSL